MTLDLSEDDLGVLLNCIGALLATMSLDVPAGQPTPQAMREVEALQAKLMAIRDGQK